MSVLAVQINSAGQVPNTSGLGMGMTQQTPTPIYINTNDTLATVTTTGYLNQSVTNFQYPYTNWQMAEVYTTDSGVVWLRVSITTSAGHLVYSLVAPSESGSITTPTVANQIAYATNTLGTIAAAGLTTALFNLGNISAGKSGTAGILESYPSAATSGKLELVGVANAGDYAVAISNASFNQASTVSFADVGSSAGRFLVANTATPFTSGNFPKASGTGGLMVDSGIAVTSLIVNANNSGQTITATSASATPGTIRTLRGLATLTNATYANTTNSVAGLRGEVDLIGASSGFVYGVQGKVIPTGTLSGSIWAPAVFGQYDLSAATINAGQIAAVWGDMGATGGTFTDVTGARMFAGTNTIASLTLNSMIYLYGKATNLLELSGSSSTYISSGGAGAPSGTVQKIAITIDGTTYYVVASTVVS